MRGLLASVLLLAAAATLACGPTVDLTSAIQVLDVSTGWNDAGLVNGQNKLVPSVAFKLKNISDQMLPSLQANVIFRRGAETEDWGAVFLTVAGSEGLAPDATTDELVAKSQLGYTGIEARLEMLQNSHFVDAHADVFAKYASTQWVKIGEYPIERRLLAP